jgi:hypothetical protein
MAKEYLKKLCSKNLKALMALTFKTNNEFSSKYSFELGELRQIYRLIDISTKSE